jgi:FkbM family methyltransferase
LRFRFFTVFLLVGWSCLATAFIVAGIERAFVVNKWFSSRSDRDLIIPSIKEAFGLLHFYSQFGQDRWLVVHVFPGLRTGYFVDVGSADGILRSNTKALEDLGWRGICIDPFPTNMDGRTCTMVKEVISSSDGKQVTFQAGGVLGGIKEHIGQGQCRPDLSRVPSVQFSTSTLRTVLERAGAPSFIHYISIDVEGAELEVLKGFPFSKYQVGAWTIEHNQEEPKRELIKTLLESNGYRRSRTIEVDDFYVNLTNPLHWD